METKTTKELREKILNEYQQSEATGKALLARIYGEEFFAEANNSSFDELCTLYKVNPSDILRFSNPKNAYEEGKNAEDMLDLFYKKEVNGWTPNWDKSSEKKWIPVFKMGASFAFNSAFYTWTNAYTYGGSRLWFPTEKMATEFGKQHEALFKKVAKMGVIPTNEN